MLRDPMQIVGLWSRQDIDPRLLECHADRGWKQLLKRLGITLLVTREYEHLALALRANETTWIHIPHPSGLVVDCRQNSVHIACTRNPNVLIEFKGETLLPTRVRFFPGALYLHDLALIGGKIYGNAVGRNAIVRLDYNHGATFVWRPKCIQAGKQGYRENRLQLNSIAAGKTLENSFFSASVDRVLPQVPGDQDYPVDRRGVIFSGKTRVPVGFCLTRPHSARLWKGDLWVDNSGYGEVGKMVEGQFKSLVKLDGWTRGLCFVKDVMFVGVSRILERFQKYAPGLDHRKSQCGVRAVDPKTGKTLGSITWPYGNQIFGLDWMEKGGFPYGSKEDVARLFHQLD
jgi:uncharacterized protein (TIGR03032 family)